MLARRGVAEAGTKLPYPAVMEIEPEWHDSCGTFVHKEVIRMTGDYDGVNADNEVRLLSTRAMIEMA